MHRHKFSLRDEVPPAPRRASVAAREGGLPIYLHPNFGKSPYKQRAFIIFDIRCISLVNILTSSGAAREGLRPSIIIYDNDVTLSAF